MIIAVAGTGYVGLSIATLLAQHNTVDYSFENISYNVEFGDYHNNEKGISDWDFKMYDSDGNVLETYPVDVQYASAVSPGHKSSGQMAYALTLI